MIRVTLKYEGNEKKILVSEQKKLRECLEESDIGFSPADAAFINDRRLSEEDLEKQLLELASGDASDITIRVEYDLPWETFSSSTDDGLPVIYPSKSLVVGCACIIFSEFTPDELRDFQCFMPEALTMRDDHGDPIFAISLEETSPGSLNEYGAVFSNKTNKQGHATITIVIDPECEDTEKLVRDSLGSSILRLIRMEQHLLMKQSELDEKKSLLADHITRI